MIKPESNPAASVAETDAALFLATVGPVTPLAPANRVEPRSPSPLTRVREAGGRPAVADRLSDHGSEAAADDYLANGLSRMLLRKLRRGNWAVADSLDLHGSTTDAARRLLQDFLHQARERQLRCVLVIHGKGMNSRDGTGVLRKLARHWLAQHPQVLAYCDAPPALGGGGAVLVLLKGR